MSYGRRRGDARVLALCGGMVVPGGAERMTFEVLRSFRERGAPVHCILNGWAYDSTKYSKGAYALDVETAKSKKLGMWKEASLISPYCFRHKSSKPCRIRQSYMP